MTLVICGAWPHIRGSCPLFSIGDAQHGQGEHWDDLAKNLMFCHFQKIERRRGPLPKSFYLTGCVPRGPRGPKKSR